jgi:hypothetical protein
MNYLSGSLYLGDRPNFSDDILPLDIVEIYEGSTMHLTYRSLRNPATTWTWGNVNPGAIGEVIQAMVALVLPAQDGHRLAKNKKLTDRDYVVIDQLASIARADWRGEIAATLHPGCSVQREHLIELRHGSLYVYEETFSRPQPHLTIGDEN